MEENKLMSWHCGTCGRNLQNNVCLYCDKPGIFVAGDIVMVTPIGLTGVETKEFLESERLTVYSMNPNYSTGPYALFKDCPVCIGKHGGTYCRGHWTGAKSGDGIYKGTSNFKKVTS
jgi:hypothetical protein